MLTPFLAGWPYWQVRRGTGRDGVRSRPLGLRSEAVGSSRFRRRPDQSPLSLLSSCSLLVVASRRRRRRSPVPAAHFCRRRRKSPVPAAMVSWGDGEESSEALSSASTEVSTLAHSFRVSTNWGMKFPVKYILDVSIFAHKFVNFPSIYACVEYHYNLRLRIQWRCSCPM